MRCVDAAAVIAVKAFVEENQIFEMLIVVQKIGAAIDASSAGFVGSKEADEPVANFVGRQPQVLLSARTGREPRREVFLEVVVYDVNVLLCASNCRTFSPTARITWTLGGRKREYGSSQNRALHE